MNRLKKAFIARFVCALVLIALIVAHIVPIPIFETLVLFVVLSRPRWFKDLVSLIYYEEDGNSNATREN